MLTVAYRNELEKLFYRKKYFVFLFLDILSCLVLAVSRLLAEIISDGAIDTAVLFKDMLVSGMSWYLMLFIPLMAILACADLFSGEYHDLSIRMVLQRPLERWQIFLSKTAAVFTLCAMFVLAHFIILFLMRLAFGQTVAGAGYALVAYIIDLVPVMVTVLFFAVLHQLVPSSGSAVALSVVAFAALVAIGKYVTVCGGLVFTEYLCWHSMWMGTLVPLRVFLPKLGILLGSGVILYCLGYGLFDRKEI